MENLFLVLVLIWFALGLALVTGTRSTMNLFQLPLLTGCMRIISLPALAFGIGFIVAAFTNPCFFWIPFVLGLVALFKGVYFLTAPIDRVKALLQWTFEGLSEPFIRLWGAMSLVVCTLLLNAIL